MAANKQRLHYSRQARVLRHEEHFARVLEGLRANSLETAGLSYDHLCIRPEKAFQLAETLKRNTSVTRLCLQGRALSTRVVAALAPALKDSRVRELDLCGCGIGEKGVKALLAAIQGSCLKRLVLAENDIHNEGAIALFLALKGSAVAELFLGHNRIADVGAKCLAACLKETALRELGLGGNLLQHEGLKAIALQLSSSQLRALWLDNHSMDDEDAEALAAGLKGSLVSKLDVRNNQIGAKGAAALAAILGDSALTVIQASGNDIREEGAQAFLEALPNSGVLYLDLDLRRFSHRATWELIEAALEANRKRSFILQLFVEGAEPEWKLTFRTMGGTVAAVLDWSARRHVMELPDAVFDAMKRAGFPLPCKHLRTQNLKILKRNGEILDVDVTAADMATQLAEHPTDSATQLAEHPTDSATQLPENKRRRLK